MFCNRSVFFCFPTAMRLALLLLLRENDVSSVGLRFIFNGSSGGRWVEAVLKVLLVIIGSSVGLDIFSEAKEQFELSVNTCL